MKFMKFVLALAIALCATVSASHAQSVQFLGGGSSALFLELGQAAQSSASTGTPCVWTSKSSANILARDDRTSPSTDEQGNFWVTWGKGTGSCGAPSGSFNIYAYQQLDSVVGDKCYFMVSSSSTSGCIQVIAVAAGTAGADLLQSGSQFGPDTPIPASIISALNGKRYFVIGTDIRPEDAKFASKRMFTTCGTALTREPFGASSYSTAGLGYQTSKAGVGVPVKSFFSTKLFNVIDFNITGTDPITGKAVRGYSVSTVGAQPIVVAVSPASSWTGATDIDASTLALFQDGTLGRTGDILGVTTDNAVTVLAREPLSGTYNTMEYSVPNSVQFRTSQDAHNCSGTVVSSNPMDITSANGKVSGAARKRVIGTGEMVATLQAAATPTLGYFFWSAGNAAKFTSTNGKYLTVNGVDPLANSYSVTNGVFPTGTSLSEVTFKNLNDGDYPIWSALRLVSTSPTPAGVINLVSGAQSLNSTQNDFITLAKLNVWHSHFTISSIGITTAANGDHINAANDLCSGGTAEAGGDAGGSTIGKEANRDFCADFGSKFGLTDRNN
jgi:hypothetical protein